MQYLKQSTAVTLKIGPFVDDTDGKTAETGLTIAQADVRLSKNGANIIQKNEASSCTHDELGVYGCPIDATDTGTLGRLQLWVHESGALPVWHEFMVLPANVFDSLFSTDKLEVDLLQIGGVAQSATDLKDFTDTGYDPSAHRTQAQMKGLDDGLITAAKIAADAITAAKIAADAIGASEFAQAAADKVWGTAARALTDKAGFALSTAGILAIWHQLTANIVTANTIGKLLKDDINATISSRSSHNAAAIWSAGSRALSTPADYIADVSSLALEATLTAMKGATFAGATDSLEAIRDRGDAAWLTGAGGSDRLLMVDTTIATLASQTSFTLTSGSADDDAYNNCTIVIEDVSTATQKAVGTIFNYAGATKTVTLKYDPAIFAIAVTDKVYILAENALKSTLANRQLNVAADGDIAGNIDGSVASVVGHTAQTGDSFARLGAPAAASIAADLLAIDNFVDELESRLSATRAGYLDNLSAGAVALASVCTETRLAELAAANLPSDIDAILADTGTTLNTHLLDIKGTGFVKDTHSLPQCLTATGFSTHNAAAVWSVGTRALTDKAGFALSAAGITAIWEKNISAFSGAGYAGTYLKTLYDDWLNAGRLDLILDAIAADVVNLDGVAMRGTDSAALASVCTEARLAHLNADISSRSSHAAADIWSVATRALTDKVGFALTTAEKAAIIDAAWDELIADHLGAGSTGKELSEATAPTVEEVADQVWDELQSGHTNAGSFGKYLDTEVSGVGGVGSGALSCTWTQKDSEGNPMDNVQVWITTDEAGANVVAGTRLTDASGEVSFMLDEGTYYVWREKGGFNFDNPQSWAVS